MQIAMPSPFHKLCFKVVCLLVFLAYVAVAARDYVAFQLGISQGRHAMEEAIALEPSNAEYHHSLGSYLVLSEKRPDLAIPHYSSAVTLNPHLADYWLDLAKAYASTGDGRQQEMALKRALEIDPNTPMVSWEVANGFLLQGDLQKAFRVFRHLLQTDTSKTETIVQICWYATHNLDAMLRDVLPATPDAYLALVKLLIGEGEKEAAEQTWSGLVALRKPFDPQLAKPYLEYLITQHDIAKAQAAWSDLGRIDPAFQPYRASAANLVVNGGFEQSLLNMGFDWRYEIKPRVSLALDAQGSHGDNRSLSVTFDGEAVVDAGISQFIAVEPNTGYKFSAFVKSDDIFAANGPQFVISDAYDKKPLLLTEELLGTTNWRQVSGSFHTGPDTRLVLLKLGQALGAGPIIGKLWIDDVILVRE